jgi:hypothetical protein
MNQQGCFSHRPPAKPGLEYVNRSKRLKTVSHLKVAISQTFSTDPVSDLLPLGFGYTLVSFLYQTPWSKRHTLWPKNPPL